MIYISVDNTRRVKHHELIVRHSGEAYKATIIGEGKVRIEGTEAGSMKAALESLFEVTAEILEESNDVLEEVYDGEKLVERIGGSRIAHEATPPPEASVNGDGIDVADRAEATVMARKRGRPKKTYTNTPGRPRMSMMPDAATGDEAEGEPAQKRGRGRPRKSILASDAATGDEVENADDGEPPQKRGPGRPRKSKA